MDFGICHAPSSLARARKESLRSTPIEQAVDREHTASVQRRRTPTRHLAGGAVWHRTTQSPILQTSGVKRASKNASAQITRGKHRGTALHRANNRARTSTLGRDYDPDPSVTLHRYSAFCTKRVKLRRLLEVGPCPATSTVPHAIPPFQESSRSHH